MAKTKDETVTATPTSEPVAVQVTEGSNRVVLEGQPRLGPVQKREVMNEGIVVETR